MEKYLDRARIWGQVGAGACLTVRAYTVYIASVLLYVGQLEDLPRNFDHLEARAVQALFPGPRTWLTAGCAKELRALGVPWELRDVRASVQAAQARVV